MAPLVDMAGVTRTMLLLAITIASANALEAMKVLNIPEKIIGGVIDIVQNHKNKPTQVNYQQSQQSQQVFQQGSPQQYAPYQSWNTGFQSSQAQNQGQYVYPTQGNYNTNSGQFSSGQQFSGQYPVSQGSYQTQNQNGNFEQSSQFQGQSGMQGQGQYPVYGQQTGQYQNTNQQTNTNVQGTNHNNFQGTSGQQHFLGSTSNQQANYQQPTTGFVGQQQTGFNQQSNYVGQSTFGTTHPQGAQTGFGNHQTSQLQGSTGSTGSSGFQVTSGHQTGPGPSCVCQAWTKPKEERSEVLSDSPPEKSFEVNKTE